MLDGLQIEATISDYIPEEQGAYEDFCDAGGQISEATRIEISKAKFGVKLQAGYDLHVQTEACKHGPDELLEKSWGRFITVLEKVGRAVGPEDTAAAVRKPSVPRKSGKKTEYDSNVCWEHTYGGHCKFGDRCKYGGHDEPAGSRMKEVADEFGVCLNFLEHGGCHRLERGKCPFTHGEGDTMTALSAEQHAAIVNYAEAKGKEAHNVKLAEVIADGGVEKWKTAADKQQRQKPKI